MGLFESNCAIRIPRVKPVFGVRRSRSKSANRPFFSFSTRICSLRQILPEFPQTKMSFLLKTSQKFRWVFSTLLCLEIKRSLSNRSHASPPLSPRMPRSAMSCHHTPYSAGDPCSCLIRPTRLAGDALPAVNLTGGLFTQLCGSLCREWAWRGLARRGRRCPARRRRHAVLEPPRGHGET